MEKQTGRTTMVFYGECKYLGREIPLFCWYVNDEFPISIECNHSRCKYQENCNLYQEYLHTPLFRILGEP